LTYVHPACKQHDVAGATTLHVRRGARAAARWCAALTALWLVLCGVLGLRHQAVVDHARDDRSGSLVHAPRMTGHHDARTVGTDLHGRHDAGEDDGPCALVSVHPASIAQPAHVADVVAIGRPVARIERAVQPAIPAESILRLAPKTSPPAA